MTATGGLGPSFESTLEQARAGDSIAFDALYNAYAGRIRAFAAARGSDQADEVTNDVMLRAFQYLSSFRGDEVAFVRWLFTIARNRLIDLHRAAARRPVLVTNDVPDREYPSAETGALHNLSLDEVAKLLAVLTEDQREVVALRLVDDLSLADVAAIVDRTVTAVKGLQRRGLQRLQREIMGEVVS